MKTVVTLLAVLLLGGALFTGCKGNQVPDHELYELEDTPGTDPCRWC